MEEIWKSKVGFKNYQISNYGRIKYFKNKTDSFGNIIPHIDRIRKLTNDKDGYLKIRIMSDDSKQKDFQVHSLVAELFCDNPNNYKIVNHKDGVKKNNNYENLEWVTQKMNVEHSIENGLTKPVFWDNRCVNKLDDNGNILEKFISITSASRSVKVTPNRIRNCCIGKSKTSGGFRWEFSDEQIERKNEYLPIYGNIFKIDVNWNLIEKYPSVKIASIDNNICVKSIRKCCNGQQNTAYGFIWRYENKITEDELILLDSENIIIVENSNWTNTPKRIKKVNIVDDSFIEYDSIKKAAKENKLTPKSIRSYCKNSNKAYNSYKWFFI